MSNAANKTNNGEKNVIKVTGKEIVELVKKSEASRLGLTGYWPVLTAQDGNRYQLRCYSKASACFNGCPEMKAKLQDECVYQAFAISKRGKTTKCHTLVVDGNVGYIIRGFSTGSMMAHGQAYATWSNGLPTIKKADGAMYL